MTIRKLSILILILGVFSKNASTTGDWFMAMDSDSVYSVILEMEQMEEEVQASYSIPFFKPLRSNGFIKIQNQTIERNKIVETPPPQKVIV
jgi:hypothetical protein